MKVSLWYRILFVSIGMNLRMVDKLAHWFLNHLLYRLLCDQNDTSIFDAKKLIALSTVNMI